MNTPAIYLGDFTAERSVLIAIVPQDAEEGDQLRAIHLLVGETLEPDSANYWLLQLGVGATGQFKISAPEVSLAGGLTVNVVLTVPFNDPALFSRGARLMARLTPRGSPPPLVGLSMAPEWGILSSRKSARS